MNRDEERATSRPAGPRWSWSRSFAALAGDAPLVVWGIAVLTLGRAAMIAVLRRHMSAVSGAWEIESVFLNGLRFDIRDATLLALPSLAMSVVALRRDYDEARRRLRVRMAKALALLAAALVAIDISYFEEFGDQFNHFLFGLALDDRTAILKTIWKGYPVVQAALFVTVATVIAWRLAPLVVAWRGPSAAALERLPRVAKVGVSVLAFVAFAFCARGSIGRRPAQMKAAAVTPDVFLNKMVASPFDCLFVSVTDYLRLSMTNGGLGQFLRDGDIRSAARRYFHDGRDLNDLDQWSRRLAPGAARPPRHVIVIVMESYSSWPMLPQWQPLHLADSLLDLSQRGVAVTRFISAGPGTMASLGTIISGLPDSGLSLSYEPSSRAPFPTSLPELFHQLGYRTRFFYGGYPSWQRIGDFARDQGFDEVHGGGEMGNWLLEGKEWGVDDEYVFDFAQKQIRDDVPSFDLILSVSNHPPFGVDLASRGLEYGRIPPSLASQFDGTIDTNVLGHFRYADRCLGTFVKGAERRLTAPLFAITGDHYGRKFPNAHPTLFERLAVPMVFYGPEVLKGRAIDPRQAGSHIDLVPTLVDLAAPAGFAYCAFGHDLLGPAEDAAGLGTSAAITATGVMEMPSAGGAIDKEGNLDAGSLRIRYDDLHALGWWRAHKGSALPPRIPATRTTARRS